MKRGSALLMALWIILTLSVIVLSFAFEAKLQGGINVYVQGKNRVKRLIDAGRILGEVVLLGYQDGKQWTEDEDLKQELEDDRWYVEKQALKYSSKCTIGPILLDEEDPDSGTVKVEISLNSSDADQGSGININTLCQDGDPNFEDRWRLILDQCGVPRDEIKDPEDGKTINLQSYIIACWQDYRDEDDNTYSVADTQTARGYTPEESSEKTLYEEYYDDHDKDFAEEDRFELANGEIGDLKELSRVICFRKFPAVLTGGPLYPTETDEHGHTRKSDKKEKDEIIITKGLMNSGLLSVTGDGKVNVNRCTVEQLLTVPGIFDVDEIDEDDKSESRAIAEAIVACRKIMPQDYDVPEDRTEWGYGEFTSDWWSDLTKRIADECDIDVTNLDAAKEYLTALPSDDNTLFKMKITASLMDMEYTAECECYVKDKKVRYISWKEN